MEQLLGASSNRMFEICQQQKAILDPVWRRKTMSLWSFARMIGRKEGISLVFFQNMNLKIIKQPCDFLCE